MSRSDIELSGVRVNNLKNISVRIRRNALTVICGVSGSGKSSLAFDTLFAEGQRRYVDTFSPYARQFLNQVERPAADRIDGIPPAIAIRQNASTERRRSTVGSRTEIIDYFRILFARLGSVVCPDCGGQTRSSTPDSVAAQLAADGEGRRAVLAFLSAPEEAEEPQEHVARLISSGFTRIISNGTFQRLDADGQTDSLTAPLLVVADRIRIAADSTDRIAESVEMIFRESQGECIALVEDSQPDTSGATDETADSASEAVPRDIIDDKPWIRHSFSRSPHCPACHRQLPTASAELLNNQSAIGACPTCEGFGSVSGMTFDKVVPDPKLSLQEGAIRPWTTAAYRHELDELLELSDEYNIPADIPFRDLPTAALQLIQNGVPEQQFGGLNGFHKWLVRNRYKKGVGIFLSRWRSWLTCPDCHGSRLNPEASLIHWGGKSINDIANMQVDQLHHWLTDQLNSLQETHIQALKPVISQIHRRLEFLTDCGVGYLSLGRPLNTLSGGESQRVALTTAFGSGLVNTLYVLDEPTSGLHFRDTRQIIRATRQLQASGNTVVVVEHDPDFIMAADEVIEIGPEAGSEGGQIVFQGPPAQLKDQADTHTGRALRTSQPDSDPPVNHETTDTTSPRTPEHWLQLQRVTCHNVINVDVSIPLEVICVVTGVSGSGKSSLIADAFYPCLARQLGQVADQQDGVTIGSLQGTEHLDAVEFLDQSALQKSSRSIAATYINAFDDIRKLFAETHEAKKRNLKPGAFSFNSARGGRCEHCDGRGFLTIEMQFLADIQTTCEQCRGRRYRDDILEVRYRGLSIHEVLQMTADEAFAFFSGHRKIQQRLNALRQAGLGYLTLRQTTQSLSGGEAQRLRIASLLAGEQTQPDDDTRPSTRKSNSSNRTLFILDEPSTGLHVVDIHNLMQSLNHLVQIGHSVLIIEHDQQVIAAADHVIELGPAAGRDGGRIVYEGPPVSPVPAEPNA